MSWTRGTTTYALSPVTVNSSASIRSCCEPRNMRMTDHERTDGRSAPVRGRFNRGDVKTMASIFAVPGMILDGMAPHVWHGTTAAQDWYRDVLVEGEQHGVS